MIPVKRVNRIVLSRCSCGATKTDMIKKFTKAETVDRFLASFNEKLGKNE